MPSQFNSPEGNLEDYFVSESWLIDQYIGDKLYAWGTNDSGKLGINDYGTRSTPVTTFAGGTDWEQVSCAYHLTLAIKTDGTLWTWGRNAEGGLGTNDQSTRFTPVTTFAGGTNWKQVSCGRSSVAAIKTDGTLWTWGYNDNGQLGTNDLTNRSTPVTTFAGGTNWKQVSSGSEYHTAAIKTDGTLWTWGRANNGRLGTSDETPNRSTPVTTFAGGTNWKQVSGGSNHTAAIKTDGTLWAWGENSFGQLGDNDNAFKSTPVTTFAGGTNWKQVDCGFRITSAIKNDGTLWNWGSGSQGSLGNGSLSNSNKPVTTFAGGTNWKQVSCGSNNHKAAIKTDGTLWTWGRGDQASLGNNSNTLNNSTPVTTFAGGNNWRQVSCGGYHVLAVTTGISPDLPIA